MKTIKKMLPFIGWFFLLTLVTFAISSMLIPEAEKIKKTTTDTKEEIKMDILRVSAVGDSLTEGIGDTTHTGGYVPLLQTDLSENYPIDVVQAENFGKSGDRSDQILKRIKKDEEMQNSIR
ncbi:MAG: hypothetical protein RSC33_05915 [Vagococcus sp.]